MSEQIKVRVGEVEYEGDKEFAKNKLADLVAVLSEASGGAQAATGTDTQKTASEADRVEDGPSGMQEGDASRQKTERSIGSFDSLAVLLHKANWKTDQNKALTTAAFLQENGDDEITTEGINEVLKPLNKDIKEISTAAKALESKGYFLHVGKESRFKQYKVLEDGMDEVERLLRSEEAE